jgi:hypothetical protein
MDTATRKDRFDLSPRIGKNGKVRNVELTDERLAILLSFEDYRVRPTNWIVADFPDVAETTTSVSLSRMAYKPFQWVRRRTFHGDDNRNETMSYTRDVNGDELLQKLGYQLLPRSKKQDREQALVDIVRMSTARGAKENGTEILFRKDYYLDPRLKDLMQTFNGLFSIDLGDEKIYPDEFPSIIRKDGKAITIIEELDRATEDTKKIIEKLEKYKKFWQRKDWLGFPPMMLRFITTSEVRKRHLMENVKHLFDGKCGYILWGSIEDHTVRRFTQPVTSKYFDEPYARIGSAPFSLKEMRGLE